MLESIDLSNLHFLLAAIAALALGIFAVMRARRALRQLRERLHGEWGKPRDKLRDMDAIAGYYGATPASDDSAIDDRTWEDLELDRVFAWADRTESAIGQQRLYRRLRLPIRLIPSSTTWSATSVVTWNGATRYRSR